MYEIEVKARLQNREAVLKKLKSMGCSFRKEQRLRDQFISAVNQENRGNK